jgi:hypothetical protein
MTSPQRSYRYYDFVMAAFVCVLLCANLIGAAKAAQITLPFIGAVSFSGGVLFFPDLVYFRRHSDRGVWLWPRPARGLGGLCRAGIRQLHGRRGARLAAGAGCLQPKPTRRILKPCSATPGALWPAR